MINIIDHTIKISVRNLVEFILRSGDIDNRRGAYFDKDAMQEGSRIHRKIQRQMGPNYNAEQSLKAEFPVDEFLIKLEGRADGIITNDDEVIIDEIKSMYADISFIEEPLLVHKAQAMCYGYIYATQNQLTNISIQVTYCNIESEAIKRFVEEYTIEQLEEWLQGVLNEFIRWARFLYQSKQIRNMSIKGLEFPFPYRNGQRKLAVSVYQTINRKKTLFIQAPTGVGKTMSTIFPAVKAMGEDLDDKIFYLTAKTITRTVAEEAFDILRDQGLEIKSVTITAKDKLCLCEETNCNPDACPYAKGHYDRVNEAVYSLVISNDNITRDCLLDYAKKYTVCPFEMCLDVTYWVDVVICDYNYVFDPNVRLKRYFAEGVKGEYIFLVDEAHNLVERAREMFSASLYKDNFLEIKRLVAHKNSVLARLLEKCNKYFLAWRKQAGSYLIIHDLDDFIMELLKLQTQLELFFEHGDLGEESYRANTLRKKKTKLLKQEEKQSYQMSLDMFVGNKELLEENKELSDDNSNITDEDEEQEVDDYDNREIDDYDNLEVDDNNTINTRKKIVEFYLDVRNFLKIYELVDKSYVIYGEITEEKGFMIKLLCVDTSTNLRSCLEKGNATVFFSATLLPIQYYKALLNNNPEDYAVYVESPFNPENRLLMVANDVSSKYTRRNTDEYNRIFEYIKQVAESRKGNYIVFFPSYSYMQEIYEVALQQQWDHEVDLLKQKSFMLEEEREEFLDHFEPVREKALVAFCVLGGVFSEGIDLKFDRLIGTMIVGTGLPMVCNEREILKNFYDERNENGFDFAYLYPGMNKVLQAAGRVIRTEKDQGIILLLDERFTNYQYKNLFPQDWEEYQVVNLKTVQSTVDSFWRS